MSVRNFLQEARLSLRLPIVLFL